MTKKIMKSLQIWSVVLVLSGLFAATSVPAGCYCMMQSQTAFAGYNKTGYNDFTTNVIKNVYMSSFYLFETSAKLF